MIRARRLEKRYGDKRVLHGIDFELPDDGFLVVTGPNGSGKTTLLRLCAGLAVPTRGELTVTHERAGSYSRGMLQRLALCRTLLHEPELLILDEPYSALDEDGAALLDRELAELRCRAAFVVATHDPARVDSLATARLALA